MANSYQHVHEGNTGYAETDRALICVWGKEAVQFLDGMVTNDMKTLEDGQHMRAAFPNVQGRLLALVTILRVGDRYFIETESVAREKLFQNLFRFTFAGDFFAEDQTELYRCFEIFGTAPEPVEGAHSIVIDGITRTFVPMASAPEYRSRLQAVGAEIISEEDLELLRIEYGIPKYGVDVDETTVVPELGLDGLISYTKGCYIGQEIIARIHFRGHVAKRLAGLVADLPTADEGLVPGAHLNSGEGKDAGRITSAVFSPSVGRRIGLGFVRYDHLAPGTRLFSTTGPVLVVSLPFEK